MREYKTKSADVSEREHWNTLPRACEKLESEGFELVTVIPGERHFYGQSVTILYRERGNDGKR
jgi:hypothetical protein